MRQAGVPAGVVNIVTTRNAGPVVSAAFLGYRQVELSAKVLTLLVVAEFLIVLVIDLAVLAVGGDSGLNAKPFTSEYFFMGALSRPAFLASSAPLRLLNGEKGKQTSGCGSGWNGGPIRPTGERKRTRDQRKESRPSPFPSAGLGRAVKFAKSAPRTRLYHGQIAIDGNDPENSFGIFCRRPSGRFPQLKSTSPNLGGSVGPTPPCPIGWNASADESTITPLSTLLRLGETTPLPSRPSASVQLVLRQAVPPRFSG